MFNSKNIKRIILLIITFCILLSVKSFAVVSQTKDFFVNDYAGVLTEETKNYIIQTNAELQQKTGVQIVVVTIKSLEGESIEEYATNLFRNFGIGDKTKNNGGNSMIEVYCTLIIKGVKTIEDVPLVIREQVIERLKQLEVPVK